MLPPAPVWSESPIREALRRSLHTVVSRVLPQSGRNEFFPGEIRYMLEFVFQSSLADDWTLASAG
jgi:hypothetical protein